MKVLVTGAGGFIGRVLTPMLSDRGHTVVGLDVCDAVSTADEWVRIEPNSPLNFDLMPKQVDAIIHLAQSPDYRLGQAGEKSVFTTNVALYADLLRYAADAGVKQFTSASTGTLYEPFSGAMDESAPISPTGYYGASKLAAEVLANAYRDRFKVCNFRLFFVYGPRQKDMLIARLIDSIRAGKTVNLPSQGDGLEFVPTFVDDVARCFIQSIEDSWEGTINIASPEAVSFKTVLETIAAELGTTLVVERKGDSPAYPIVPSLEKLKGLTNISAFHSLQSGIRKAIVK